MVRYTVLHKLCIQALLQIYPLAMPSASHGNVCHSAMLQWQWPGDRGHIHVRTSLKTVAHLLAALLCCLGLVLPGLLLVLHDVVPVFPAIPATDSRDTQMLNRLMLMLPH